MFPNALLSVILARSNAARPQCNACYHGKANLQLVPSVLLCFHGLHRAYYAGPALNACPEGGPNGRPVALLDDIR
jgi:hypothetical protein